MISVRVQRFKRFGGGEDIYEVPDPWPSCPECDDWVYFGWVDVTNPYSAPDRHFIPGEMSCHNNHVPARPPRKKP
jgi:hypothetical protein